MLTLLILWDICILFADSSQEMLWSAKRVLWAVGKMWPELWVTTATPCVPHQDLLWNLHWRPAAEETIRSCLSLSYLFPPVFQFSEKDMFSVQAFFSGVGIGSLLPCHVCNIYSSLCNSGNVTQYVTKVISLAVFFLMTSRSKSNASPL